MRTTVRIDDDLYRSVKERAARTGRTVSAVLEDAVRAGIGGHDDPPRASYSVRTTGSGGLMPGVDLSSNASMRETLDSDVAIDALR